MSAKAKKIKEFVSVTGADKDIAKHFLDACGNNLETAIAMFLDDKHESGEAGGSSKNTHAEDEVRAPIPQTSGVLVDDPHYTTTSNDRWMSRRRPRTVFDAFRDFKSETNQQEQLLASSGRSKQYKRLEDLFRPPLELMHRGTFETAREQGKSSCKWLMVNVQNVKEFSCQVLNRDVWSKPAIQSQIKNHFVFWQVYSDSTEGDRFMTFYPVTSWPHVSLLDPRTGERLASWNKINSNNISGKIQEFLADHGSISEEENGPPSKRSKVDHSLIDEPEDSQLAAAIAASLKESTTKQNIDDDATSSESSEISGFEDSDDDVITEKQKPANKCNGNLSKNTISQKNNSKPQISEEIDETKIEESYFSSKKNENSEKLGKTNKKSVTQHSSDANSHEKHEKVYKKVQTPKLKVGTIENGKDLSSLTNDKYNHELKTTEQNVDEKNLCRIMVRFPDGTREQIQMDTNCTVKDLSSRLTMRGYSSEDYEIVTNFPRKNISTSGAHKTLKEVGLFPRATVFVQEREI